MAASIFLAALVGGMAQNSPIKWRLVRESLIGHDLVPAKRASPDISSAAYRAPNSLWAFGELFSSKAVICALQGCLRVLENEQRVYGLQIS